MLKKNIIDILILFLLIASGCQKTVQFEKEIIFEQNKVNTKSPELVCQISEENALIGYIANFTILNDTTFVVVTGTDAYLYHISGTFLKKFGNRGQAKGEMISPTLVYATSDFVYIWCASLLKFLIFDFEANFIKEISGFNRALKKFVVNPSNEILYLYTSGYVIHSENKTIDIIYIYNITEESSRKFAERGPEDQILYSYRNSSGFYVETDIDIDRLIFLHPGNLIVHDYNLFTDTIVRYKIDDDEFHTTRIKSGSTDIIEDMPKLANYIANNSIVRDIYKDNGQFVIISEIGQFDLDERYQPMKDSKKRKLKLYFLDSFFNPNFTILYDYVESSNYVIHSGYMYFITIDLNNDDQLIFLNRFNLSNLYKS